LQDVAGHAASALAEVQSAVVVQVFVHHDPWPPTKHCG
jgi:hypothetical protein